MELRGFTQSSLARAVGLAQPSINRLLQGDVQHPRFLPEIANALQTTIEYLRGETDNPDPGVRFDGQHASPQYAGDVVDPEQVDIDSIDFAYGMGGAFLDSDSVEIEKKSFPLSWVREFTDSPPHMLAFARGMGDSMAPTIHDRDIVLIDRSQTDWLDNLGDRIWVIVFGGVGMIKRLRPMPDGSVKIMSDNPVISDEVATDGELFVIGRVCGKSGRL